MINQANQWAEPLTEAEAAELYDRIQRGAFRALDVAIGEHGLASPLYHDWRDIARDAAGIQVNLSTAHGWGF